MKPRDNWDREDWLDYLDGWHEASDLGFKTHRNLNRRVTWLEPFGSPRQQESSTARETYEQGKADQAKVAA